MQHADPNVLKILCDRNQAARQSEYLQRFDDYRQAQQHSQSDGAEAPARASTAVKPPPSARGAGPRYPTPFATARKAPAAASGSLSFGAARVEKRGGGAARASAMGAGAERTIMPRKKDEGWKVWNTGF